MNIKLDENCVLLGYYIGSRGNFLTTFWDNLLVPSSRIKKIGPIGCPEMSVRKYCFSLRNNPKERSSQIEV